MIVVKPKTVNSVHSSKESLKCSRFKISKRHFLTDALEATELVSLNTNAKKTMLSGKRWR